MSPYLWASCSKRLFTQRVMRVSWPLSGHTHALMIGESVIATNPDMTTAMASVKANSLKSTPERPERKPIGAYTTASVMVMAIIGESSRREEASAACFLVIPSRRFLATFSTTTMASSTTRPTESTIARMVSRFMEKPIRDIAAVAPSMEMGMVNSGTRALRAEPISARTTRPTSKMVSPSVLKISATASRM